ncbi:hypothetical protein DV737_g3830, partial [Chaetothyriales sp. CBS 132003]
MRLYDIALLAFASTALGVPVNDDSTADVVVSVDPAFVQQLVAGNATSLDTVQLGKRTDYGFYQCSFEGYCKKIMGVQDGVCRKNLMGTSASMCPDKGIQCTVYENRKCSGVGIYPFGYPGIPDFLWNIWWGAVSTTKTRDPPGSYRCQIVHHQYLSEGEGG